MVDPDALRAEAEELYGLAPGDFTAARSAAVKRLRAAGERGLAAEVGALRRPALAAWAVNLLVRQRPELIEQVVGLGEALREAQALLRGAALRDLTRRRRQLVTAVTAEVRGAAADAGQRLSDQVARQVEETLQAAMADPQAARAVRSGLLAQPLASDGLASLAEVVAVPFAERPKPSGPPSLRVVRDDSRALALAQERVAEAAARVRKASTERDRAAAEHDRSRAAVLQVAAEVDELRRRLAQAEAQAERAAEEEAARGEVLAEAEEDLATAREQAEQAAQALDRLREGVAPVDGPVD